MKKNNQRGFIIQVVIVIVVLILIGVGIYYATIKKELIPKVDKVVENNRLDTSELKTYKNEKYGFEFKYSSILNALSLDPKTKGFFYATSQDDKIFLSTYTPNQLNGNLGKEVGGIWISISDKKSYEPINIISKKDIFIDGHKAIEYNTKDGMEDTQFTLIRFQDNGKIFDISEWSSVRLLDPILSTFKFTSSTNIIHEDRGGM